MSRKFWNHKLSFKLSRGIGRRLAVGLAFSLLLVVGNPLSVVEGRQAAQDQDRAAAQKKFEEGEALRKQGTEEALRLAVKKYEEALPLWRRIGDPRGEVLTLESIGSAYYFLGEKQKALDFHKQSLPLYRAAGDREEEARTLYNIGYIYQLLGENRKALDFYAQSLPLQRAISNRQGEALILGRMGSAYDSLGEWRKAIDFYNQWLPFHRAFGDKSGEADTLKKIGLAYYSLGDNKQAVDFFMRATHLYREAGDRREEAVILNYTGASYRSLGENMKSLGFYILALEIQREIGDRSGEGVTLNNIGVAYDSLGEKRKALESYDKALPLLRAAGNRLTEARTLANVGEAYKSLGERRKALDFYDQALAIQRAAGDRMGETATLNVIGQVYSSLGEMRKALDFFTQSQTIQRAIGYREIEAGTLNNIGYLYHSLGDNKKALDFCNQALALDRAAGDRNGEAATLNNIATIYFEYGERQKALDFYNQSLPLSRAVGNRQQEAGTLNNIGHLYNSLGESRKALDFLTQALALARAVGDRGGEAAALNNIGSAYRWLGEIQKAIEFYTEALAIHRAAGDRGGEAGLLGNIGGIYSSLGEKQKALDFYNQALTIRRATGDRSGEATTLNNIALVHNSLGENNKALDLLTQALALARAVGDRHGETAILNNIARTKRDLGHFDESRSHVESALKIIEAIRAEVVSKDLRASYFATQQGAYEFYVDLLMRMHNRGPARGHDAEALEASERGRARSLLDSLTEANADIRRGADPKLLAQEESLQQRLNAKAEETLKLSANGADEARLAMSRRETDALTVELQQVQTQIRQTSPRYSALTQPQPLTLAEIQRQALDADTLLLEYSLGKERSYLWAVTPTTINSYELPKREEIEAAAKRVHELLSSASGVRGQAARPGTSGLKEVGGGYLTEAAGLSRALLGPVAAQLGKKRLLIVADGMLHYVPFGALPDPNSLDKSDESWQPLLVEHEIVNLPSASTIAVLRRELAGRKPAAKTLAVLADPVFSRDDERIKPGASLAAQPDAQRDPLDESRARILVEIGGDAPNDLRIKRLPFTRQEAEAIMALTPAGSGKKALDFEASRATATSERLSQYRYVHFATHGLADSERPELSTLVLSLYDEQGRPQDGFLRAHEVYNLELPAELVTLSACETGLGKLTRGEGLVSLTRGFIYAGAARVVVSLWSVSDRATSELMVKFYRRILVGGERPAAALRAAQVEMWRDKRWEAPYYWAAFTLQGEWR